MNRFRKLDDGTWGIACEERYERGEEALVERRNGTSEVLRVGDFIGTSGYGEHIYRIMPMVGDARTGPAPARKLPPINPQSDKDEVPF
jgi:hypothetical protein